MATPVDPITGTLDDVGAIGLDVGCVSCQYNLRGLTPEGNCPECGKRIEESLAAWQEAQRSGLYDPIFIRKLARGMDLGVAASLMPVPILSVMAAAAAGGSSSPAIGEALFGVGLILGAAACAIFGRGCWLFTEPPPVGIPVLREGRLRLAARWSTLVFSAAVPFLLPALYFDLPVGAIATLIAILSGGIALVALKFYAGSLAMLINRENLASLFGVTILGDFLVVSFALVNPGCAAALGLLACGLLTCALFWSLRRSLLRWAGKLVMPEVQR